MPITTAQRILFYEFENTSFLEGYFSYKKDLYQLLMQLPAVEHDPGSCYFFKDGKKTSFGLRILGPLKPGEQSLQAGINVVDFISLSGAKEVDFDEFLQRQNEKVLYRISNLERRDSNFQLAVYELS